MTQESEAVPRTIPFPCCPKEKVVVYEEVRGRVSIRCPRCDKFAEFDFTRMVSRPAGPYRLITKKLVSPQKT